MSVVGVILSNLHDGDLPSLTARRTMGAVPFGGRYRLIDFPLSAMVHAGLTQIFVVAHHNYRSLMEHIGSGKDWDMARHNGGIHILPPYSAAYAAPDENYNSRLRSLISIRNRLEDLDAEDVLCCDCDAVGTPDLSALISAHRQSGRMMTVCEEEGAPLGSLHLWIASAPYLRALLREAENKRYTSFYGELIAREIKRGNVGGFRFSTPFYHIRSISDYYRLHMMLAGDEIVRRELLECEDRPVMTKVQNSPPAKYGKNAKVEQSLVADGCVIEGRVKNSVLFRGVYVGPEAAVENAVVLEHCTLTGHARVAVSVLEKNAVLGGHVSISGHPDLPFFVDEGRKID